MDGDLAACRSAKRISDPRENPRMDFSRAGSGNVIVTCQGISSHGGRVSNMQKCKALLQSRKNPRKDFFWRHTPDWKGAGRVAVGNGAGAEPWKAGDAGHGRSD